MTQVKAKSEFETTSASQPRLVLRDISPDGEQMSVDDVALVSGGACSSPRKDGDATCIGGKPD